MILDKILFRKREEVAAAAAEKPLSELKKLLATLPEPRGFAKSLQRQANSGTAIIAEVKKGSPSKGIIRADFDPVAIAREYQAGGASCLSVLTDREFFFGDLSYLRQIREVVELPLLRKDFIIDPYQLVEARVSGADAILLIVAALDDQSLESLSAQAQTLGLDVLVEVHDEAEMMRALPLPVPLIGINNRDLKTFHTDLAVSEQLAPMVRDGRLVVAESGIDVPQDIARLKKAGAGAFLIGESLMREKDISAKLSELLA